MKASRYLLAAALFAWSIAAPADEATIRRALEPRLGVKIDGVQPGPVQGLFEVRFRTPDGVQVLYVDATGTYVIQGKIYDLRTDRDLTDERLRKLMRYRIVSKTSFAELPPRVEYRLTGFGERFSVLMDEVERLQSEVERDAA